MNGQHRDRQLMSKSPEAGRTASMSPSNGSRAETPGSHRVGTEGLLQDTCAWVFLFSAVHFDSFSTSVKIAGFLWEVTRALNSLYCLYNQISFLAITFFFLQSKQSK